MNISINKYRELFELRAKGKLSSMECTKSLCGILNLKYFEGMTICDVGCGVGHYFRELRELGKIKYFGVDLDPRMITIAKETWKDIANVEFDVQDASKLEFEDNLFDVVFCYNLLFHVNDYKPVLRELVRVSNKYVLVRALFDDDTHTNSIDASDEYCNIYSRGGFQYNTYARNDIAKYLKDIGVQQFKFIKDNIPIPNENIEEQAKILDVDPSMFSKTIEGDEQQILGGLNLNYEVLYIEK